MNNKECAIEDIQFIKYSETTGNPIMKYERHLEVEYHKSGLVKTCKWINDGPKEITEVNKKSLWINKKIRRLFKILNRDDLTPIITDDDTGRTIEVHMCNGEILEYPATCDSKDGKVFFFYYDSLEFEEL